MTQQSSATVPAGSVISQNPTAGASVAAGSAVNLVVSTGPASVSGAERGGPDAVGGDDRDHECGTGAGHGDQQSSATVPAGNVISQNPSAGTSVAAASAMNLVVSTGPATAAASVTPTSLAFGNQMLNVTSPGQTVTITNTCRGPANQLGLTDWQQSRPFHPKHKLSKSIAGRWHLHRDRGFQTDLDGLQVGESDGCTGRWCNQQDRVLVWNRRQLFVLCFADQPGLWQRGPSTTSAARQSP